MAKDQKSTVFVAGASGWLGRNIVEQLLERGYQVVALVRGSSDTSGVLQRRGVRLAVGDVDDPGSIKPEHFEGVEYAISALGLRSMDITDAALNRTLRDGTLAVFRRAAEAGGVKRFVLVAGGIHTDAAGVPVRSMDHNAAREAAIDEMRAACEAAPGGIAWTAVDASVFFKDVGRFFDAAVKDGAILLVGRHAFDGVRFNPISGRDLAATMVGAMTDPALANSRTRAGGPEIFTFRQLTALIGEVLGREIKCRVLPVLPARALCAALRVAAKASQSARLLGAWRFLNFVLIVSLDETEESLVGPVCGQDSVRDYLAQRAAELRQQEKGAGQGQGEQQQQAGSTGEAPDGAQLANEK